MVYQYPWARQCIHLYPHWRFLGSFGFGRFFKRNLPIICNPYNNVVNWTLSAIFLKEIFSYGVPPGPRVSTSWREFKIFYKWKCCFLGLVISTWLFSKKRGITGLPRTVRNSSCGANFFNPYNFKSVFLPVFHISYFSIYRLKNNEKILINFRKRCQGECW